MLEMLKKNLLVDGERKEEDLKDLIILHDMGYDTGIYSHIRIQYGLVDARTVHSAIDEVDGGYQRLLKSARVVNITQNFHWSMLNPITICVREDGSRYNVDGQARVSSVITLYKKGEISTPMMPCLILTNTTLEDEAMLFGTQDDGKTPLREYQKAKSKFIGKDKEICGLAGALMDCGIRLFTDVQAYKTIREIYDNTDLEVFKRFCKVISNAWLNGTKAQKKNATCADILTGLSIFYSKYADEINDRDLVKKLSEKTPDAIRELFGNYENKLDPDRKYLKTFSMLYNKGKHKYRIDYM